MNVSFSKVLDGCHDLALLDPTLVEEVNATPK
jgi:hypothetical protein